MSFAEAIALLQREAARMNTEARIQSASAAPCGAGRQQALEMAARLSARAQGYLNAAQVLAATRAPGAVTP